MYPKISKSVTLKTAFKYYRDNLSNDYCGVITLDSDGQHSVSDVINISNVLVDNDMFILGTRLFNTKETPLRNKTGNRITSYVFKWLYGVYLKDTQTGVSYLLLTIYLSYVAFDEELDYEYPFN